MPKMPPLEAWICDTCGLETDAAGGWVEWLAPAPRGGPHSFRICHNQVRCMKHDGHDDRSDLHLVQFLGVDGQQLLLSFLDHGPLLDPHEDRGPDRPSDMRSFVEVWRRLQIPHYEEARLYFADALADGWFADHNEVSIGLPKTCRLIIERYG